MIVKAVSRDPVVMALQVEVGSAPKQTSTEIDNEDEPVEDDEDVLNLHGDPACTLKHFVEVRIDGAHADE